MTTRDQGQDQIELNLLGLRKNHSHSEASAPSSTHPHHRLARLRSFRDISKIKPEIVKSVIAKASDGAMSMKSSGDGSSTASAPLPLPDPNAIPQFQLLRTHPIFPRGENNLKKDSETAPMTIFYNGTVSVFDVPVEKAEGIIQLAIEIEGKGSSRNDTETQIHSSSINARSPQHILLHQLNNGDMPIKRKESLQRFFEKRKERLISVSPYPDPYASTTMASSIG